MEEGSARVGVELTPAASGGAIIPPDQSFFNDLNGELTDKGFLVTSTEDLFQWARTGSHKPTAEKLTEYKCGFPAFEDSRSQFDVRFYLVAILFIIFDLEAAFLYPWAVTVFKLGFHAGWAGWITMMVFLGELVIGFIYAWKKGALDWE